MKTKKLMVLMLTACFILGASHTDVFAKELTGKIKSVQNAETTKNTKNKEDASAASKEEKISKETTSTTLQVKDAMSSSLDEAVSVVKAELQSQPAYTQEDIKLLSAIIYCEAGNHSFDGKLAVANVIINRVKSNIFDHTNSIKEVIYDLKRWGRQFSPAYKKGSNGQWTTKGTSLEKALQLYTTKEYSSNAQKEQMEQSKKAAKAALEGKNNIGNYLYFNSHISSTKAKCNRENKSYKIIDTHIFY